MPFIDLYKRAYAQLGRPVDLVGMDACLMTMLEVAYQIKDHARILVGRNVSTALVLVPVVDAADKRRDQRYPRVRAGYRLGKTEQDTRDDFKGGYDFEEAFIKPYRPTPRGPLARGSTPSASPERYRGADRNSKSSGKLSSSSN